MQELLFASLDRYPQKSLALLSEKDRQKLMDRK